MSEPDINSVLMTLQSPLPAVRDDRDDEISVEDFGTVCNFLSLFRCIFYVRTLQVGLNRASSEYHRLGDWKQIVRPALTERDFLLIPQDDVQVWSMKIDGFGSMESMMNSDFMAAFWAREEFRLCDSVLVQDPDTLLFRRDLELEIQCNAPLLDWDASEGPLQIVINTRFNIPEESLRESKVLVSSARPAFLRLLAKMEGKQDIPSQFRLSTGLVDLSQGVLPTGGSQALYHLVAEIPQYKDGRWGKIRTRLDPDFDFFYHRDSSTLSILIYASFDAGSMPYLSQRRNSAVPEQKESSDTIGQSSGPSVFGSATPTSSAFPITPNPSVAAPLKQEVVPQPAVKASAKRGNNTQTRIRKGGTDGKEVAVGVDNNIKLPTAL
ncbi:unnamed protein product [Clonostachys rhizophaga]|uniref:Uncharacterized protein n=1 Tax=Clonostachys rhizophaga TaxID=160324 RepID=A0A9N9UWZ0_9HYPO|nr:unnamed protein product [Clonostachys rhizophaga]